MTIVTDEVIQNTRDLTAIPESPKIPTHEEIDNIITESELCCGDFIYYKCRPLIPCDDVNNNIVLENLLLDFRYQGYILSKNEPRYFSYRLVETPALIDAKSKKALALGGVVFRPMTVGKIGFGGVSAIRIYGNAPLDVIAKLNEHIQHCLDKKVENIITNKESIKYWVESYQRSDSSMTDSTTKSLIKYLIKYLDIR